MNRVHAETSESDPTATMPFTVTNKRQMESKVPRLQFIAGQAHCRFKRRFIRLKQPIDIRLGSEQRMAPFY